MRICAVSDLHGQFPEIPECDLLIVAGDLCPDVCWGARAREFPDWQLAWFEDIFVPWAERQPAEFVVVTWGNHDYCGHLRLNAEYGKKTSVVCDAPVMVNGVKLWLTPWSNQFMNWAFMKPHAELGEIYAKIPEDVDILVSHQPPCGFSDLYPDLGTGKLEHVASSELLYHIERVRPSIVVCGHLHGGYGTHQHGNTTIYNVAVLDEGYRMKHPATVFDYE